MSTQQQDSCVLQAWNALHASTILAIHQPLIEITGSLKAAIFLSQLVYWTKVGVNLIANDGWIFKQTKAMQCETGLTLDEQKTARCLLIAGGLIEEKRSGVGAKLAYRINLQNLQQKLCKVLQINFVKNDLTFDSIRAGETFRLFFSKVIAYHRDLAEITHDINAAVMLSIAFKKVIGNHNKFKRLLSSLTITDWKKACGLSYKEQQLARRKLREQHLIFENHLISSSRWFTSINGILLLKLLNAAKIPKTTKNEKNTLQALINQQSAAFKNTVSSFSEHQQNQGFASTKIICHSDCGKGETRNVEKVKLGLGKRENLDCGKGKTYKEVLVFDYIQNNYNAFTARFDLSQISKTGGGGMNCLSPLMTNHPPEDLNKQNVGINTNRNHELQAIFPKNISWPKQFSINERDSAKKLCQSLLNKFNTDNVQLLFDEIAGSTNVRSPLDQLGNIQINRQTIKWNKKTGFYLNWKQVNEIMDNANLTLDERIDYVHINTIKIHLNYIFRSIVTQMRIIGEAIANTSEMGDMLDLIPKNMMDDFQLNWLDE